MDKKRLAVIGIIILLITGGFFLQDKQINPTSGSGKKAVEESFEKQVSEKKKELEEAKGHYCPDTIVLNNTTKEQAESLAKKLGAKVRLTKQGDYATLYLPDGMSIEDVYENEEYKADLLSMTPDYTVSTAAVDALGHELMASRPQYTVTDTYYQSQGYLDYLNVQDSWNTSKGAGVKVAIIDTGIDTDNPEFAGRISEMSYNASNDRVVRDYGMDEIEDTDGHGTQVAGVLAAGMDGNGITGIAPEVELIVIKCEIDNSGVYVRGSDLVFGLAYAIECDADVVNMSFSSSEDLFKKYTKLAVDSDIICVASAGNTGSGLPVYPAADKNVIGVGATDVEGWDLAYYSNFGDNSELVAPGTVFTTTIENQYEYSMGTSMACPVTAGVVALYLADHPHLEFKALCRLLEASCIDLGTPGEDWYYGYGALDVTSFLCGQLGTITYEMQTDDLANQTQTFIRGHSVQTMPEPEREGLVFDGWFFDPECTDECDYYTHIFTEDITLYASWNNEDDATPFIYVIQNDETIEIRSYTGKRRYLTIPEKIEGRTVSSIGASAFENNRKICSLLLPSTVSAIGDMAFKNCENLQAIDIPEKTVSIGIEAFAGCVRMSSVTIAPKGNLTFIGKEAFSMCAISSFVIPENLTKIGEDVFLKSINIRSLTVTEGNNTFQIINHALYNISGDTLLYCPAGLTEDYIVSSGTKKIGASAFAYNRMKSIILPEGLSVIGEAAFLSSTGLNKITIPKSVTTMGERSFSSSHYLSEVEFAENSSLKKIPNQAFRDCHRLNKIIIPSSVEIIGNMAFAFSGLETITFESESALLLINQYAFANTPLKRIDIPNTVTDIGEGAFSYSSLSSIEFTDDSQCHKIGRFTFRNCISLNKIEFPDSLSQLGQQALYMSGLQKVSIGNNLTDIEDGAFSYCQKLEEINVSDGNTAYSSFDGMLYDRERRELLVCPASRKGIVRLDNNTKKIRGYAFSGTNQLTNVELNEGLLEICSNAFLESGIQTPVLPSSLQTIEEEAFKKCLNMTNKLMIPKNVISIGRFAVYGDINIREIEFESDSSLSRIGYGTFACCGIETITIPENITSMGQEVFTDCKNLTTVTFEGNNRLHSLAAWTFQGADNLRRITFEEGSQLQIIEARACEWLISLDKIDLSGCHNLKKINNYAFNNCKSLNTIMLPESLEEIGRYAFDGCNSLNRMDLPETLTWIGRYAFKETKQMNLYFKASVLPSELEINWDYGVSEYYLGVDEMINSGDWIYALTKDGKASVLSYLGSDEVIDLSTIDGYEVVSIGGNAFNGNSTIKSIVLPETVTGIYRRSFANTSVLSHVTLPETLEIIDAEAFANSGVETIVIPKNSHLKTIGKKAFSETLSLKEFSLPDGVQNISDYAFWKSGIESITFGVESKLNTIGKYSFAGSHLQSLNLPDSILKIEDNAFRETADLKEIHFGTGTDIKLGAHAFYGSGLDTVNLPGTVSTIGELCFAACSSLSAINVDESNTRYSSDEGVLFNKEMTTLITCPAGKLGSYTIQTSVSRFAIAAFECCRLSEISIPDNSNLITIGSRTFFKCKELEKIHISSGVQSIESFAFAYDSSLTTVEIGTDSFLSGIYNSAFYCCEKLTSIHIPDTVQEIGDYAFYGCAMLNNVLFGENSRLKGVYNHAFEYSGITEFLMPEGMLDIGAYAFHGASINRITFNDSITTIGDFAFADSGMKQNNELIIPDSVEYIGTGILENVTSLSSITVPFIGESIDDTVHSFFYFFNRIENDNLINIKNVTITKATIVPKNAFSDYYSLEKINLSNNVKTICDGAFSNCVNLSIDKLPDSIQEIGEYSFYACHELRIDTLPINVYYVGARSFELCDGISSLFLPKSLKHIEEAAFSSMLSLTFFEVDPENDYYCSTDGILYDKLKETIISVPPMLKGEISIPQGIRRISENTFAYCRYLTQVSLPDSLEEIGGYAFAYCTELKKMTIPENVHLVGRMALFDCINLKELYILGHIEYLNSMFEACDSLEILILPEGLKSVSFRSCRNLKEIVLPDSVERSDFAGCTNLKYLYLGKNLYSIAENGNRFEERFEGCNNLERIDVSEDNEFFSSKEGILYSKDNRRIMFVPRNIKGKITIEEGVTEINSCAFEGCTEITYIHLPDSLRTIGDLAFSRCNKLSDICLGNNIKSIGGSVFYDTVISRDEHNWINGNLYVDHCLIESNFKEKTLEVLPGTRLIAQSAFRNNEYIKEVKLPNSLRYINDDAFLHCAIEKLKLNDGLLEIGSEAFSYCKLQSLEVPESVTFIGCNAFVNDEELQYLIIHSNKIAPTDMGLNSIMGYWSYNGYEGTQHLKTIRVRDLNYNIKTILEGVSCDNLIVDNILTDDIPIDANRIYVDSEKDDDIFTGSWNTLNSAFFREDWHYISYYVGDYLRRIDPLKTGSVIRIPSNNEVMKYLPDNSKISGWDINNDGKSDSLPSTLIEDTVAVAVYDTPITSIDMNSECQIEVGETYTVEAICLPEEHTHEESIQFTSTDESILTVDENGKIKGIAEGTATVTAKLTEDNSITAKCKVTVIPTQYGIKLDETSGVLNTSETMSLTPRYVLPENYTEEIIWGSSNDAIAEVSEGIITANAPGRALISITCGEYTTSYQLDVLQPLTGVNISEEKLTLAVNDTYTLTVGYLPENTTANKTISWYSTQPAVAIVDETGAVTAKGPGTAQIYAVVEDKDICCTVTVTVPLQSVILNTTTGTMRLDRTKQLEMIFTPANTTDDKTLTWSTENPEVATVSDTGLVTAVSKGKTTITGTVGIGTEREMSATYAVTVIGLKDNKTGIIVANANDTEMADNVSLSVNYLNETEDFSDISGQIQGSLAGYKMEDMQIYDISLMRGSDSIQPDTNVDVEIPVSEEMVSEDTIIYRLEADGTLTDMEASYEEGRYTFETEHFSIYVLGKRRPVKKVESIQITPDQLILCPGKEATLMATVLPKDADDPSVDWYSTDERIATVSEGGAITAVSEGTVTITAASRNGSGVQASAAVTISHTWNGGAVTKEPTCTEKGVLTYTCQICGETRTEEILELGHSYTVVVTEPTCIEGGYTTHTCGRCGDTYVDNDTNATGHIWNEGEITKPLTPVEKGEKTYKCTVCGAERTEEILATAADVTSWINNLPQTLSSTDEQTVNDVLTVLDDLTMDQKELLSSEILEKAANIKKAMSVISSIGVSDVGNPASVEAARKLYESLTEDQKKLIDAGTLSKLSKAEEKVKTKIIPVSSISLSGISNQIAAGQKISLTATVAPYNTANKTLKWTLDNPKVATVNQNGLVTIKKKAGGQSVRIIASATDGSGKQAVFTIKVMKGSVKKITIKAPGKTLKVGKTMKLKAVIKATKGKPVNKKLKWISDNPNFATVSATGKVKALKAGKGKKVKITAMATDGTGKKKTVTITIK